MGWGHRWTDKFESRRSSTKIESKLFFTGPFSFGGWSSPIKNHIVQWQLYSTYVKNGRSFKIVPIFQHMACVEFGRHFTTRFFNATYDHLLSLSLSPSLFFFSNAKKRHSSVSSFPKLIFLIHVLSSFLRFDICKIEQISFF